MRQDTKTDLYKYINTLDSIDDLDLVRSMIKTRSNELARETKSGLIIGEKVIISGSNKIESGKIVEINRTRAVVDCFDKKKDCMIHYTVPFTMIRKVVQPNG